MAAAQTHSTLGKICYVSFKVKYIPTGLNSNMRYLLKRNEDMYFHARKHTQQFLAASFVIANN